MSKQSLLLSVSFLFFCVTAGFAQSTTTARQVVVNNGIGLGSAIAVAISWSQNKSILWAIIHGILSWFYVIYYYLTRKAE